MIIPTQAPPDKYRDKLRGCVITSVACKPDES